MVVSSQEGCWCPAPGLLEGSVAAWEGWGGIRPGWDIGRCPSAECPPSAAPRLEDVLVDASLSWKPCSVVFPFLLWHSQPNLELSLKHKPPSCFVCRGGLRGTEEQVAVPVCCTERGASLGWFPSSAWHSSLVCRQERRETFWDFLNAPRNVHWH